MKPNFSGRTAKIMADIRTRTCIDRFDTAAIEEILQDALNEYYYDDLEKAVESAYDAGYDEGRSEGYSDGYSEGHSDGYYEGYSDGYEYGYE